MTIKEIESLSEMVRANIRYYEQEGFLAPRRAPNGYRDYSDDDLQTLKRIKLLRSLDIPLEEIRALQTGGSELADTLARKSRELERVRRDAAYAQDICRIMREDRVTYATLDAEKYLDAIPRSASADRFFSIASDAAPQVFHPWRRYLARMLDLWLYNVLWSALLALCFHVNLLSRGGILDYLDAVVAALLMLFLEPLLLRFFGTTPGKWIFGLYMENENGGHPGYADGLARTWAVIVYGLGLYIPIYNLVRLWKSYKLCADNKPQPWDDRLVYAIRDTKWYRGAAFAGAYAALFGLLVLVIFAAQLPPNRGELTIAEFAENYNSLAAYYNLENEKYLNPEGKWADGRTEEHIMRVDLMQTPEPEFVFTTDNGYLTGVRYEIDIDGGDALIGSGDREMVLTAVAFAGARAPMFSSCRNDIVSAVSESSFRSFSLEVDGAVILCNFEYSGYMKGTADAGFLMPEEGAVTHYHMFFSVDRAAG